MFIHEPYLHSNGYTGRIDLKLTRNFYFCQSCRLWNQVGKTHAVYGI